MLSISSLIEFIMKLLRDADTQAEFARDPQGVLARNGLHNLSAQDVCDVAPMVADHAGVLAKNGGHEPFPHHDNAVGALSHIKDHYIVKKVLVAEPKHYDITYIDDRDNIINVDNRVTTSIQAGGDVNIKDSFNQDNDVNLIDHSFNQDNDGVDNKHGSIEHGAVAGTSDSKHDPSGHDPSGHDPSGSGKADTDSSGHGTTDTARAPSGHDTADPALSDLPESDHADHDLTKVDESSVDPSGADDDDHYDEHHLGDEFHLVG